MSVRLQDLMHSWQSGLQKITGIESLCLQLQTVRVSLRNPFGVNNYLIYIFILRYRPYLQMVGPSILMEVGLLVINLCHYNFSANIHLFRMKDTNILLDVNSGAVHVLDDQTFYFVQELIGNQGDWDLALSRTAAAYSPEVAEEIGKRLKRPFTPEVFSPKRRRLTSITAVSFPNHLP